VLAGHYGVGFAAAFLERRTPLWALLLASQLPDIVFAGFALSGIEHLRLAPGTGAALPFDPVFPYSHSLLGGCALALVVFVSARMAPRLRSPALVLAVVVATHWFLDVPMYGPILPLYDEAARIGFGIWRYPTVAFLFEAVVLAAGLALALLVRPDRKVIVALGGAMAISHVVVYAIPDKTFVTSTQTLLLGLSLWLGFPAVACWRPDLPRTGRPQSPE
jgi:hypothetical protein